VVESGALIVPTQSPELDHVGERVLGTVSAFVGTGAFVTLDEPFVDVLVRLEDLGAEYQIEDDGLMATSSRSGDAIRCAGRRGLGWSVERGGGRRRRLRGWDGRAE
jgi:hypothetical protein